MNLILSIAAGGALGAVLRHFMAYRVSTVFGTGFPIGTLSVNVLGSFLLGLMVTLFAEKLNLSQEVRAFLTVGLMGGFTTFSAFSMETVLLLERHNYSGAALYILVSVGLAVGALVIGIMAGRLFA